MIQEGQMRKGLWKLNNFLLSYGLSHEKSYSSHHNFSKRGKYIRWSNKIGIFKVLNKIK